MIFHQIKNINKDTKMIKGNQIKILELKSIKTELKNSLEGFKSRFEHGEERISGPKDKSVEIIQSKEQEEKKN